MKILFILPDFYDYNSIIKNKLLEMNIQAFLLNDGPKESLFFRILKKINKKLSDKIVFNYYHKQFKIYSKYNFDKIVLIFGGKYFSKEIFYLMKNFFPKAETIYYNWDSCKNFPNILSFYNLFDYFYSFDNYDCEKYGFIFLPLFYTKRNCISLKENQCLSIMTFSYKKAKKYYEIKKVIPGNIPIKEYLYLGHYSTFLYNKIFRYGYFKNYKKKDFVFRKISLKDTLDFISNSKFVIDVALPNQCGLTIRTFEALANGTKIITSNKEIKKYPFFSSQNIYILNEKNDENFFNSNFDYKFLLNTSYSLDNFLKKLLRM